MSARASLLPLLLASCGDASSSSPPPAAPAAAGSVALLPGRAATIPPCEPKPRAKCWQDAPLLARFAAPAGVAAAPVDAAVRLAHQDGALLVKADGLPAGSWLEITVEAKEAEDPNTSAFGEARAGVTAIPIDAKLGDVRSFTLNLVSPDGAGRVARPWSPAGPGDDQHPALAVFAAAPTAGLPVELKLEGEELRVLAPGASQVRVAKERLEFPRARRGVPDPWSAAGADSLAVKRPAEAGWYDVQARWTDASGATTDAAAYRFYLPLAPAQEDLAAAGIHPAPLWTRAPAAGEAGFQLAPGAAVAYADDSLRPAAALLAEELARVTGLAVAAERGDPQPGDLWVGPLDQPPAGLPEIPGKGKEIAQNPEGFALVVDAQRAAVLAPDLRGAVYGSLALVDAFAAAGAPSAPVGPLLAADRPQIAERALYHQINIGNRGPLDLGAYRQLIRQVVTRGRYNLLILALRDTVRFDSHPELATRYTLEKEQVRGLIATARELGIEVTFGVSGVSGAAWLTDSHPEMKANSSNDLLCTRHPGVYPLLSDLYGELFALFDRPRRVHIGHDEIHWSRDRVFGDERDPRCGGATPQWVLLGETLAWHVDYFAERNATVFAWSDMFVEGWNGRREGAHRALDRLTPEQRESLTFAAWSGVGESVENLTAKGYPVMRLHTGYQDWKRAGLPQYKDQIAGEGLALFFPFPWQPFGIGAGSRPLYYYWTNVLLAGTTAWRPALAHTPIADVLMGADELPAFRPGYRRATRWSGRSEPLALQGAAPDGRVPDVAWPAQAEAGGVAYRLQPAVARPDQPVVIPAAGPAAGVSVLLAAVVDFDARSALFDAYSRPEPPPIAALRVRWADGQSAEVPLLYGQHAFDLASPDPAYYLWQSAGTALLPSAAAQASAGSGEDRLLYRLDWENPRPDQALASVEVAALRPGVAVVVAGANRMAMK